jgi:hypothetical protein
LTRLKLALPKLIVEAPLRESSTTLLTLPTALIRTFGAIIGVRVPSPSTRKRMRRAAWSGFRG